MKKSLYTAISVLLLALTSCSSNSVKISGAFYNIKDSSIIMERVEGNKITTLDTIKTLSDGSFKTKYKFENDTPVFINLKSGVENITLLVKPGENVDVQSVVNHSRNYNVTGSKGSQQVKELALALQISSNSIDSLYALYNESGLESEKNELLKEINKVYINHKKANINFLMKNTGSLASVIALYQRMPNGVNVFGSKNDIQYFRMVNDSLNKLYPTSNYIKAMSLDIKDQENRNTLDAMILNSALNKNSIGLPNIELKDIYGKEQKLLDLKGKIILLYFWSYTMQNSSLVNAELRNIYKEMKSKGLEIYQVSLDDDKATWISTIINQKLPWINVLDPNGPASISARNYNISTMPANFLIDRDGNIVAKNIWGIDILNKVNQLTK